MLLKSGALDKKVHVVSNVNRIETNFRTPVNREKNIFLIHNSRFNISIQNCGEKKSYDIMTKG